MKILAIADLHADFTALKRIKAIAKREKPDVIVDAGDMSVFGRDLEIVGFELDSLEIPLLVIHGNHESEEQMKYMQKALSNVTQIHKKHKIIGDVLFIGYGGGGFAVEDSEFDKLAKKFETIIKKNKDKKVVFVVHGPPHGTETDYIKRIGHVGSKSVRRFIEKNNIDLVITGHIEDCRKKTDKIGKTRIVNPEYKGKMVKV